MVDDASAKKRGLIRELVAELGREIATMTRAHEEARVAATHEEAKPENDKDTRALEASYLAAGQASRIAELELAVRVLEGLPLRAERTVCAPSVVTLEDDDGGRTVYLVLPHGGGVRLSLDGAPVTVVTPQSPLGAAMLGRSEGDVIEVRIKGGKRELTIHGVW